MDHLAIFGPSQAAELKDVLECCDQALYRVLHTLRESNDIERVRGTWVYRLVEERQYDDDGQGRHRPPVQGDL